MFIEEISSKPENELADKLDRLTKDLSRACEMGMSLLEQDGIEKSDEDALVDIIASIKGAKKALHKLSIRYSDIDEDKIKKIDSKSDDFLLGLGIEESKAEKKDKKEYKKEEKEETEEEK